MRFEHRTFNIQRRSGEELEKYPGQPELLTNYLLQRRIWKRLLRYASSASSTYRRGYACGVLGRRPRSRSQLHRFATKAGEKCGVGKGKAFRANLCLEMMQSI